ncbi:MAG: WecB/TagA/CpsF family glycosyltransferase [Magnetococcales bacterium]|nr:WecB/TagA/CpsF family glycosyltransferase [Magnetococcales bacterium]
MSRKSTEMILGYPVTLSGVEGVVAEVFSWLDSPNKTCRYFVCANPHSLEVARVDPLFHQAILASDLILPDGIGISLASKLLGGQIRGRITGSNLFYQLSAALNQREGGGSCFFLGSTPEVLGRLTQLMARDYPNITVAGVYSPPFRTEFSAEENQKMVDVVNQAKPDLLWVGMTAPKQEKWIYHNRHQLQVSLAGPIGAVLNFYSGDRERASPFFRRIGLEWLPRFLKEPRRLWRRNLVSNPAFVLRVLAERVKRVKG